MKRRTNQDTNRSEPDSSTTSNPRTNKSHDQREAEYAAARERIFQDFKPPTEEEEEDVVTRAQPQSKPTPEHAESPKSSFNVDAAPFIPSSTSHEPIHEQQSLHHLYPFIPVESSTLLILVLLMLLNTS